MSSAIQELINKLPDPVGDFPPPSSRFLNALTKLLPQGLSTTTMQSQVVSYLKLLTSDPELDDPLPIFQVLLNEAQLKRGGCDLLSVYKGLLRVFPLDENLWAKWCVRALDQGVGLPLIAQIVDMNLSGVVGWLVHLKLNYGLDVASYAKPANAASAWMKQDGVLVTKKEAEKVSHGLVVLGCLYPNPNSLPFTSRASYPTAPPLPPPPVLHVPLSDAVPRRSAVEGV
jgi:hypothetical protein